MPESSSRVHPRLDHVAVWVADTEKTCDFLTNVVGWRRHPMKMAVSDAEETTGGMLATFIDAGGFWLELIEPTSPGPGMDLLEELGDGALVELDFEIGDEYEAALAEMAERGIEMLSMDGSPLVGGGRIHEGITQDGELQSPGERIAYFPSMLTRGTTVEYYERRSDDETSLLNVRDSTWNEKPDPASPRVDHICVLALDLEKTAAFYTEVMGLRRHPMKLGFDEAPKEIGEMANTFIDANGVWLEVVQPTAPGPAMELLERHCDGYLLELCVEVDDLDLHYDRMQAKGVTMVNFDGSPLAQGTKGLTLEAYGDRIHYFPLDVSRGMRIMVYERGPRESSLIHRRDDSWVK
jgi:catechol 2,3-dioxygenase-like lactoylglutathione lyase family enzyme